MAKARILIVEDDRFYIEFYRDILEKEGFKTEVAHNASEALKRIRHEPFDLVIADVVLKNASGIEFLAEVKRVDPAKDVLMVTSMQSIRKAVDALRLGASDYLTKPVDKEELILAINKILERQNVSQEQTKLISENIHFYELLRVQKKNLSLMARLDLTRLQEAIVEVLIAELNAPGGVLYLKEPGLDFYRSAAGRGALTPAEDGRDLLLRTPGLRQSLEMGKPIFESIDGDQWVPKGNEEGYRIILPIRRHHEILGAVKLGARRGERLYNSFDVDLGRNILEAAGMALANAIQVRRIEEKAIQGDWPGTYAEAAFRSFAETQLAVARRYNRELSLVLIKIENFSAVHDQIKEAQGNKFLGDLCRSMLELIRDTDLLARVEGDLFSIIVPETDFYGALMLKKRLGGKLSRTTFAIDEKREFVPQISIGAAAAPKDGVYYQSLVDAAQKRIEAEKQSLYRFIRFSSADLWDMVNLLLNPAVSEYLEKTDAGRARLLRHVVLKESDFEVLGRTMIKDLETFSVSRGLLYVGMRKVDSGSPLFRDVALKENFKISIFALGAKGESIWNVPHVTPVFINEDVITNYSFIIGITENLSYALFTVPDNGELLRGFHTSDHLLVLELISRLQEKYMLQRRIG